MEWRGDPESGSVGVGVGGHKLTDSTQQRADFVLEQMNIMRDVCGPPRVFSYSCRNNFASMVNCFICSLSNTCCDLHPRIE